MLNDDEAGQLTFISFDSLQQLQDNPDSSEGEILDRPARPETHVKSQPNPTSNFAKQWCVTVKNLLVRQWRNIRQAIPVVAILRIIHEIILVLRAKKVLSKGFMDLIFGKSFDHRKLLTKRQFRHLSVFNIDEIQCACILLRWLIFTYFKDSQFLEDIATRKIVTPQKKQKYADYVIAVRKSSKQQEPIPRRLKGVYRQIFQQSLSHYQNRSAQSQQELEKVFPQRSIPPN